MNSVPAVQLKCKEETEASSRELSPYPSSYKSLWSGAPFERSPKAVIAQQSLDVLTFIWEWCSSEDLLHLWFCGQRALNQKLALSWKTFDIEVIQKKFATTAKSWPKILRDLRVLTKVHIRASYMCGYGVETPTFGFHIEDLKALSIAGPITSFKFLQCNDSGSQTDEDALFPDIRETWSKFSRFNFSKYLPHLTKLSWNNEPIEMCRRMVKRLPPTLTSLKVRELEPIVTFEDLPRSLQVLDVAENADWTNALATNDAPLNLTRLSVRFNKRTDFNTHSIASLPQTLTSLHISFYNASGDGDAPDVDWVQALPPSLLHFTMSWRRYTPSFAYLPLGLKGLVVSLCVAKLDDFSNMPPALQSLDLWVDNGDIGESVLAALPHTLRRLRINGSNVTFTEGGAVQSLPPLIDRERFLRDHARIFAERERNRQMAAERIARAIILPAVTRPLPMPTHTPAPARPRQTNPRNDLVDC